MSRERRAAPGPAPIWSLVNDSLDEAEFLWRRWEVALSTHALDLEGVAFWIEERLFGSLDGVRVGESAALEQLILPALEADDLHRATVAAHILATETTPHAFEALAHGMRGATPERLAVFRRAVELSHSDLGLARLERELAHVSPQLSAALIDARTFQGRPPTSAIGEALTSREPALEAAALRALRGGSAQLGRSAVSAGCRSPDAGVLEAAMETGLVLGVPEAWSLCHHLAASAAPAARARLLLALVGSERDHSSLYDALAPEATRREALFALGFAGTLAAADAALRAMQDPALAQLAAEAFCAITGLDLEAERLLAAEEDAPVEPIPFEHEDLDADLVPAPEELLPRPDVAGVMSWWSSHGRSFRPGQRYLRGRPLDGAVLREALRAEPMRRRHAIALELAVRTQGHFQVQTRTFTREQKRQLQATLAPAAACSPLALSFSRS